MQLANINPTPTGWFLGQTTGFNIMKVTIFERGGVVEEEYLSKFQTFKKTKIENIAIPKKSRESGGGGKRSTSHFQDF